MGTDDYDADEINDLRHQGYVVVVLPPASCKALIPTSWKNSLWTLP